MGMSASSWKTMATTNPAYKGTGSTASSALGMKGKLGSAASGPSSGAPLPYKSGAAGIKLPGSSSPASTVASSGSTSPVSFTMPKTTAVNVQGPERPNLPEINPQAAFDPELQAYAQKYGGHLEDLKQGTGFAMDAMREQMEQRRAGAREAAMAAAAQAGIPFNASEWEAEYDRGINSALAEEKVNREAQLTQAYQGGLPIIAQPSEERFSRLNLDLTRDMGEASNILDRYKTDVSKYGTDVQAAIGSNNALLGFLSSMMGSLTSMMPSMSMGGSSYTYG